MESLFCTEQIGRYHQHGFLLVSRLIERDVVQRAYDRVLRQTRPEPGSRHALTQDPLVAACFTRNLCSAAGHLARAGVLDPPTTVYTITVFPSPAPWEWPHPHIDHALEKDAHRTFPPPFRVGCLIYLNAVSRQAGGTVVWPGSHHRLLAFAAAHRGEYEYLSSLNRDIQKVNLPNPVEITAAAGDVLFYHYLCAHAGSVNTGTQPRVALNHKW